MAKLTKKDSELLECIPSKAREFIIAINNSTHSPIPLILTCLLSTNSASLGGGSRVIFDGWEVCPNIYGMAVAPSGIGKSSGVKPIIKPLDDIQKSYRKTWEEWRLKKISELEIIIIQLDEAKKSIKKSGITIDPSLRETHEDLTAQKEHLQEITSPIAKPLLTINDFTEEALSVYASKQPYHSLYLVTAEGRNVLSIINGRYGSNGSTSETFLIMAYSGDPLAVTRLSREELRIEAHLSMFLAVQEDVFENSLRSPTFTQSGFFPRCLITRHRERIKPQPRRNPLSQELCAWWQTHLKNNYDHFRNEETVKKFKFSKQAKEILRHEEKNQLNAVQKMSTIHDSYFARHLENLMKISVNLHSLSYGAKALDKVITSKFVSKAIELMQFYRDEQLSILQDSERRADEHLKTRLIDILSETVANSNTLRDLKRRNNISPQECERISSKFPDVFCIETKQSGKKGGRPSKVIQLL